MNYGRQVDVQTASTPLYVDAGHCICQIICYLPLLVMGTMALPRRRPAMHRGVARILHWLLQKLSAKAFFRKKVDDLFSHRLQNFTVLNKAGPTSQQSQFFRKKIHSIDGWGHGPPDPLLATTLATQRNTLRPLPYSDAVCVNAAAVSALLMTLPRTGRFLTVRLLPWDTQASKQVSVLISKCCSLRCLPTHDVYMDHQR